MGKEIVVSVSEEKSDVWLMQNFDRRHHSSIPNHSKCAFCQTHFLAALDNRGASWMEASHTPLSAVWPGDRVGVAARRFLPGGFLEQ